MFSEVETVTVSPGLNCVVGRKLPPSPSESALIVPAWTPLLEPVTVIWPIEAAGIPRNTSCVAGEATWPPGIGNTSTTGVAARDRVRPAGAPDSANNATAATAVATAATDTTRRLIAGSLIIEISSGSGSAKARRSPADGTP